MSQQRTQSNILVVDDDDTLREVVGRVLEREGYGVIPAAGFSEALAAAEEHHPQLALVDYRLPDGDGLDLARRLHAQHDKLPMVMMTAYPQRVVENPDTAILFRRVLTKPMNIQELRQAVGSVLNDKEPAAQSPQEKAATPMEHAPQAPRPSIEQIELPEKIIYTTSPQVPALATVSAGSGARHVAMTKTIASAPGQPAKTTLLQKGRTVALSVLMFLVFVTVIAYVTGIRIPVLSDALKRAAADEQKASKGPDADATAGVKLVEGLEHTLFVPDEVLNALGIRKGFVDQVAVAQEPQQKRTLVLPGSTALDPGRIMRIRARFAPAEVVAIFNVEDERGKLGGPTESHELRPGDKVKKGQMLGVFYSVDVGNKKNDLFDAVAQYDLDKEIYERAEKSGVMPEVFLLNARRNVQGDLNAIHRSENTLRAWNIPEDDLEKVRQQAREWAKQNNVPNKTPETKEEIEKRLHAWARVELTAPDDGVLIERNVSLHEMVVDNTTNLFQIAKVDSILVIANAPEDDLTILQSIPPRDRQWRVSTVGAPAKGISGPFPEIGQMIDPNTHTAIVKGYIPNPDGRIRAGQFATATVDIDAPKGVVEIPIDAVVEDGKSCVVFVEQNAVKHYYTMQRVKVTHRFDKTAYVLSEGILPIDQPTEEEIKLGAMSIKPLSAGKRVIITGVGELKAALLERESQPEKKASKEGDK